MLDYLLSQYATLGRAFLEHLWMVAVVLGLSLAAAAVLTVTAMYSRVWSAFLVNLFSVIYAIPSLALFAILHRPGEDHGDHCSHPLQSICAAAQFSCRSARGGPGNA
jgi:hypothetical protein